MLENDQIMPVLAPKSQREFGIMEIQGSLLIVNTFAMISNLDQNTQQNLNHNNISIVSTSNFIQSEAAIIQTPVASY